MRLPLAVTRNLNTMNSRYLVVAGRLGDWQCQRARQPGWTLAWCVTPRRPLSLSEAQGLGHPPRWRVPASLPPAAAAAAAGTGSNLSGCRCHRDRGSESLTRRAPAGPGTSPSLPLAVGGRLRARPPGNAAGSQLQVAAAAQAARGCCQPERAIHESSRESRRAPPPRPRRRAGALAAGTWHHES